MEEIEQIKRPKKKIQIHSVTLHNGIYELDLSVEGERMPYALDPKDTHGLSSVLNPLIAELLERGLVTVQEFKGEE